MLSSYFFWFSKWDFFKGAYLQFFFYLRVYSPNRKLIVSVLRTTSWHIYITIFFYCAVTINVAQYRLLSIRQFGCLWFSVEGQCSRGPD